jgi:hypothetical protein
MEYSSVIKKKEILSFGGKCIELKITILSKVNKIKKALHVFAYMQAENNRQKS